MKLFLFFLLLLLSAHLSAQDVIIKKDRSQVRCRIEEVTDSVISYVIWGDKSETNYLMDKSLVSSIIYKDAKRESFTKPLFNPNDPYKKVRRLKNAGWIGGGFLATVGSILIITGVASGNPYAGAYGIVYGIPCIALGGVVTAPCLIVAGYKKRKIDTALGMSAIYRHNILLRNGSSLSVGADLLRDNILRHQTVGLGLSYVF